MWCCVKELLREGEGWLSEESADDLIRLDKKQVWVVDPLDGTRSLLLASRSFASPSLMSRMAAQSREEFVILQPTKYSSALWADRRHLQRAIRSSQPAHELKRRGDSRQPQ